jgi:hypothetical protein
VRVCEDSELLRHLFGEVEVEGFDFYFFLNVGSAEIEDFFAVVCSGRHFM